MLPGTTCVARGRALPALVVVRQANDLTISFIWSVMALCQVMYPASGGAAQREQLPMLYAT